MGDAETLVQALDRIMDHLRTDRYRFLDEVALWWSSELRKHHRIDPVPPDVRNPATSLTASDKWSNDAPRRLHMYLEIEHWVVERACRHTVMPEPEFAEFDQKVQQLWTLQKEAGFCHPHPSLWGEYGRGALKAHKLDLAERLLSETVTWLTPSPQVMNRRDMVRYLGDSARCAYLRGDEAQALLRADTALKVAKGLDRTDELSAFDRTSGIPFDFRPALMEAYFICMDALINAADWYNNEERRLNFNWYWQESLRNFATPKSWSHLMKITAVSDERWVRRMNTYAAAIAEDLYILMADKRYRRWLRSVRVHWWTLLETAPSIKSSDPSFTKAAAVILLLGMSYLMSATSPQREISHPPFDEPIVEVFNRYQAECPSLFTQNIITATAHTVHRQPKITLGELIDSVCAEIQNASAISSPGLESQVYASAILIADAGSSVEGM